MAVEMLAMAGVPPPGTAPPTGATLPATGSEAAPGTFAAMVAAALDTPAGAAPDAAASEISVPFGLAALLAAAAVTDDEGAPGGLDPLKSRLDRDAGAEQAAGMLAVLLLGASASQDQTPVALAVPELPVRAVDVLPAQAEVMPEPETAPLMPASVGAIGVAEVVPYEVASDASQAGLLPVQRPPTRVGAANADAPAEVPSSVADAAVAAPVTVQRLGGATGPDVTATPADATAIATLSADEAPASRMADGGSPADAERLDTVTRREADASASGTATAAYQASMQPATQSVDVTVVAPVQITATDGVQLASGIADTVQAATLRGDHELRIALNPPDLGQLEVLITSHDSGSVTVSIQASSREAHDLLQQQLPALRAGLEQREVRVEQLHVEQQEPSAGLGWTGSGQPDGRQERWDRPQQPVWSPLASMQRVTGTSPAAPAVRSSVIHAGSLDLRA